VGGSLAHRRARGRDPVSREVEGPELLTPAEVAQLFRVTPTTVTRWAKEGKLTGTRTPGGTRRYYRAQVEALLKGGRS
jgi:excisionase family DNA binding protein